MRYTGSDLLAVIEHTPPAKLLDMNPPLDDEGQRLLQLFLTINRQRDTDSILKDALINPYLEADMFVTDNNESRRQIQLLDNHYLAVSHELRKKETSK